MKKIFNTENFWVRQNNTVVDIIEHLFSSTTNNKTAFLTGDEEKSWEYNTVAIITETQNKIATPSSKIEIVTNINNLSQKIYDFIFLVDHLNMNIEKQIRNISTYMHSESLFIGLSPSLPRLKSYSNEVRSSESEIGTIYDKLGLHPTSVINTSTAYGNRELFVICLMQGDKFRRSNFVRYIETDTDDNLEYISGRHRGEYLGKKDYNDYRKVAARSAEYILREIKNNKDFTEDNPQIGILETFIDFPGFDFWDFVSNTPEVESEFQDHEILLLKDVAIAFNLIKHNAEKEQFNHEENCIYIPLLSGNQQVVTQQSELIIKHQNICQVVIDEKKASARYMQFYFNSKYGQRFLNGSYATKLGVIKRINKLDVKNLLITLPTQEQQKTISDISFKLENAIQTLEEIKGKVTQNPLSSLDEVDQLSTMLNSISSSSWLIAEESKIHEFKSSMRKPYPDYPIKKIIDGNSSYEIGKQKFSSIKQIHKYFEAIILKTIAAFLNTSGGTLVIGVEEKDRVKKIVGIEREGFESNDHYDLHLTQIIQNAFGPVITSQNITTEIINTEGHSVAIVKCDKYNGKPVDLEGRFYIRTGPKTNELSPVELIELMHHRQSINE